MCRRAGFAGFAALAALAGVAAYAQQGAPAGPNANTLDQLARAAGVQKCAQAATAVSPFMTGFGAEHGALLMAHPVAPDAAMFGATIERTTEHGPSLVSAWFAPTPRGNCDVGYDLIDVWPKACQDVAREVFNHAAPLVGVGRSVGVLALGPTHHVYLIGTTAGCVSIRKEVLYP
ncbi:hypothetical protein [Variovorax fucosicus]|uniref:hypothetical protein n=1 Tax=Variovorax fucosicus TaxID=3053517 RepID=UPI0025787835|nr:hypothetical protein [Variovorax sp. J22G47]MDM0055360.1 hypothetical protein [Variovorax sp. J22G47]